MADKTLIDPLGRQIRLHEQTWVKHILRRPPEMAPHRELLEHAVLDPIEVRISPSDNDCRFYFGNAPREGILILAVVDVHRGIVKTAHLVRAMKGDVEWSRPIP